MQNATFVCVCERIEQLTHDLQRSFESKLLFAEQSLRQRLALDKRHRVERDAVHFARIEQRHDARVTQLRRNAHLTRKASAAQ